MLFNYQEFLDSIDRKAYHEGEWQWEEDGYTVTRTYTYSAPGCHDSCGVLMYVKDGKLCKIEGDPLDPVANGRLCMRCLNLVEGVNYEKRPKWPLKRVGERGENKWERISWDEALDTIADWIHTNLDEKGFGRESIFVNHGTGRNISSWVPFLGGACLGTPNIGAVGSSGYSCYLPRTCGTAASIGDFPIVDAAECSRHLGLRAAAVQRRRLSGPLADRLHAARDEVHHHRPAAHLAGRPFRVLAEP